jgi:hypothetical protein
VSRLTTGSRIDIVNNVWNPQWFNASGATVAEKFAERQIASSMEESTDTGS